MRNPGNLVLCATVFLFASCSLLTEDLPTGGHRYAPETFSASADAGSKVYLDAAKLKWNKGDCISLFTNQSNIKYCFKGEDGDINGEFEIASGSPAPIEYKEYCYAVYPYDSATNTQKEAEINVTIPHDQEYTAGSFDPNANFMVGVSKNINDEGMVFLNVCGYIRIKLFSTNGAKITHICLKGNNGEKLAGGALISAHYMCSPKILMGTSAFQDVTLSCGESGIEIGATAETATDFIIVIPPTAFSKGFTVEVEDDLGNKYVKSTAKCIDVQRSSIHPMAAFNIYQKRDSAKITDFSVTDKNGAKYPAFFLSDCSIQILASSTADIKNLVADFTYIGESVYVNDVEQVSGVSMHDFSTPVIYTVLSKDGTKQLYEVAVTKLATKPKIGISKGNDEPKHNNYRNAVIMAGGSPVDLDYIQSEKEAETMIETLDGILMTGGYFGQTRDYTDATLIKVATKKQMPLLGICRGMLDTNNQLGGCFKQIGQSGHWGIETQTQHINIEHSSIASSLLRNTSYYVNSLHSIAIDNLDPSFKATAHADDGTIEMYEGDNIIGCQFHPERLISNYNDEGALNIFRYFIKMSYDFHLKKSSSDDEYHEKPGRW